MCVGCDEKLSGKHLKNSVYRFETMATLPAKGGAKIEKGSGGQYTAQLTTDEDLNLLVAADQTPMADLELDELKTALE